MGQLALLDAVTPENVGEDLARALTSALHRGLHHAGPSGNCDECRAGGRALAPAVGSALFVCRHRARGPLTEDDYNAIGRALEELEQVASARPKPLVRP